MLTNSLKCGGGNSKKSGRVDNRNQFQNAERRNWIVILLLTMKVNDSGNKWAIEKQSRNWSSMTISFCSWNPLFSIFYSDKSLNLASSYEDTICFTNDRGWCLLQKAKKMIYLTNLTVFLNQKFKCWLFVWNDSLCISWLQTGAHQRDFDQGANQDSLQCQRWRHQSHIASTKMSEVRSDKYFLFYHSI